jgi:PAS domain S-box-containing protein
MRPAGPPQFADPVQRHPSRQAGQDPLAGLSRVVACTTIGAFAPAQPIERSASMKAADTADEDARLDLLRALGVLDTEPEAAFDALVDCAAALTGCPIALLTLADGDRQWFKARKGLEATELPRDIAFCEHTLRDPEPIFVVPDARSDERFADHPLVAGTPHLRFYAGVPLAVDGIRLGTLCVLDTRGRELKPAQRVGLQGLARTASELLQQRRAHLALQEQSARLHDLARASGDWMWELDAQQRYRWLSGEFEPITGIDPKTVLGTRIADEPVVDAKGRPQSPRSSLHKLLQQRKSFARVVTAKAAPRGTLYLSRSAMPVFDDEGKLRGWRGTTRNVTAQVLAEREAAAQHELLAKLSSQVPGVIFQYHVDHEGRGRYLYASEGVRTVFGVDVVGADGTCLDPGLPLHLLHPDDLAGFRDSVSEAARRLTPWTREFRIVRDDGSVRWLDTRAMPERLPDGSTLFHGFTADITERKQIELALRETEARWERAADAAGIGLVEVDFAQNQLRLDRRACSVHGLPWPHAPLALDDWLAMVHEEERVGVRLGLERARHPGGHTEGRVRIVRADGSQRHVELAADARSDGHGRVTTLLGTCRDVSEQIATERLRRDKEAAERANHAKSEFLSRVSHELRTPLNSILGFAQLMALDHAHPLPPEQQRRLAGVQRAGSHLLDLIDEILDLTRIERQDFDLPLQPVDLNAAIASCLRVVQPLAARNGVSLPAAPGPACWVLAEGRALEQVLMNLISNAIKYNRPGGAVRLHLATDASHVQLSVIDEGEGLDAAQQAQLFQPFNRLGAERRRVEGTGLGLVIARELTQAMEGRLEVQSTPGEGSRFTIVLWAADPATPAEEEDTAPIALSPVAGAGAKAVRRVLYIEDEPLNVVLMEEVFRTRPGWQLQVAVDGAQGLAMAQATRPDLLLIDMNLPDMNGREVIGRLRADRRTRKLRCIAFSADAMREQIDAALAAGFDGYWTKPIDLRRMLELLVAELA